MVSWSPREERITKPCRSLLVVIGWRLLAWSWSMTSQRKAALWILGAFRTSPTGGIEALAGLIPIHLHLKKLVKRSCLRAATLPSQHALLSLLSACNSKDAHSHPQSLALLTDAQSARLRSPLLDTEASLLNLTERYNSLHPEIRPGCRLLDNFPDHVSSIPVTAPMGTLANSSSIPLTC